MDEPILVPEQRGARGKKNSLVCFTRRERAAKKSGPDAPTNAQKRPPEVTQTDLEEYILLKRRVREALGELTDKREYIETLMKSGATVERGVHQVGISVTTRTLDGASIGRGRSRLTVR